jgi:hypothetical protein
MTNMAIYTGETDTSGMLIYGQMWFSSQIHKILRVCMPGIIYRLQWLCFYIKWSINFGIKYGNSTILHNFMVSFALVFIYPHWTESKQKSDRRGTAFYLCI